MSLARELLDVELSDEGVKKLDQLNKDFLRAELVAGRYLSCLVRVLWHRVTASVITES